MPLYNVELGVVSQGNMYADVRIWAESKEEALAIAERDRIELYDNATWVENPDNTTIDDDSLWAIAAQEIHSHPIVAYEDPGIWNREDVFFSVSNTPETDIPPVILDGRVYSITTPPDPQTDSVITQYNMGEDIPD